MFYAMVTKKTYTNGCGHTENVKEIECVTTDEAVVAFNSLVEEYRAAGHIERYNECFNACFADKDNQSKDYDDVNWIIWVPMLYAAINNK